ncbi:MAG: M56 family metallopeptidase [Gemmataceae bacterium]
MIDESLLWWLAHNTLFAALLAGIVFLACRLGRLRPAVRHALWLLVLVKLATPPLLNWPWSAPAFWPSQLADSPTALASAEPTSVDNNGLAEADWQAQWHNLHGERESKLLPGDAGPDKEEFLIVQGSPELNASSPDAPSSTFAGLEIRSWHIPRFWTWGLAFAWAAAGMGMLTVQLVRVVHFRRLLTKAEAAPAELTDQVTELAVQLGVRTPKTRVAPGIASPMVWGLGRPTLLWPASLLNRLSPACQQAVIVHELAHLRRRDHWIGWLQLLAGCAWWWHPLYRYVSRQVRTNAELACDAWVVNLLPAARRAYAEALLEVSQLLSRKTEPMPVLGMAGRLDLERRLVMIMRDSVPCRLSIRSLLILGAIALIALPGWSLGQQGGPKAPREKEAATKDKTEEEKGNEGVFEIQAQFDELRSIPLNLTDDLIALEEGQQPTTGKDADRLEKLERQLEALLKEVKALRAAKKPGKAKTPARTEAKGQWGNSPNDVKFENVHLWNQGWNVNPNQAGDQPIILSRATYKMPRAKAEALAAFLRDQLKEQTLETKVEEDSIVITTMPEVQKTISQFIGLVQGKSLALELSAPEKPAVK